MEEIDAMSSLRIDFYSFADEKQKREQKREENVSKIDLVLKSVRIIVLIQPEEKQNVWRPHVSLHGDRCIVHCRQATIS